MRTLKLTLLLFALALVLTGCGKASEPSIFNDSTDGELQEETNQEINQEETTMEPDTQDQESSTSQENKMVTLKTSMGDIKLELFLEKMPITAGNFIKLAELDFYDGVTFHRVIPSFMAQGGDPLSKDDNPDNDGTGGPGYFIEDEFYPDFSNDRGTIAMANAGPNTGGSQFFINVVNNYSLDSKHPVFGKVIEGMDVADAIVNVPRDHSNSRPLEPVIIEDVVVE